MVARKILFLVIALLVLAALALISDLLPEDGIERDAGRLPLVTIVPR